MELIVPMSDLYSGADFTYYFGPNSYKVLKKVTDGYEDNVYMGYKLVSWVNKLIIVPLFSFLEQHIANYGVIIIIIVLIPIGFGSMNSQSINFAVFAAVSAKVVSTDLYFH